MTINQGPTQTTDQIRFDLEVSRILKRLEQRSIFGEPLHLKLYSDLSGALFSELDEVILDFNSLPEFIEKATRLSRIVEVKQQISYNDEG